MHLLAEASIVIARPPSVVFAFAADLAHFSLWFPRVVAIRAEDDVLPATKGKRYHETVALPLRGRREIEITVVEAELNQSLVTEGDFPPLLPRMEMRFDPTEGGAATRFGWHMHSRGDSLAAAALRGPARALMQGRARAGLARLKGLLEGDGTGAPSA